MRITKLAFINRFTVPETAAVLAASDTVPAVRVYLFKLDQAQEVDLANADTVAGVEALEAAGLLGTGRAAEILMVNRARVLAPFADAWPGEYAIVEFDGTTYRLEDAGDFAADFIEVI